MNRTGSAERPGGVIILRARAMRVHARLPEDLWPEIMPAAAYVLNRTPNRQLDWKTPLEELRRLPPACLWGQSLPIDPQYPKVGKAQAQSSHRLSSVMALIPVAILTPDGTRD